MYIHYSACFVKPVIIVTRVGNETRAIRKTPLMRVNDGANYLLVGSMGGAPKDPVWVHNLRANPQVELRDLVAVQKMRVREITNPASSNPLPMGAVRCGLLLLPLGVR